MSVHTVICKECKTFHVVVGEDAIKCNCGRRLICEAGTWRTEDEPPKTSWLKQAIAIPVWTVVLVWAGIDALIRPEKQL